MSHDVLGVKLRRYPLSGGEVTLVHCPSVSLSTCIAYSALQSVHHSCGTLNISLTATVIIYWMRARRTHSVQHFFYGVQIESVPLRFTTLFTQSLGASSN